MAITLESISNAKRIRAPRIVLLGTSGIGKSELAAGSDDAVVLPIKGEEGLDAPVVPIHDASAAPMASITVFIAGVPLIVPRTNIPPETVNSAHNSIMNGM